MQTIGDRIRQIRKSNALTQAQFSEKLCLSRPHITRIETNKENASSTVIRLMSILFKVDESWIKTGIDN